MSGAGTLTPMAKKKAEPEMKTIVVRSTVEWAEWLEGLARSYRTTVSGIIDRALTEWSESEGHKPSPPLRTPDR